VPHDKEGAADPTGCSPLDRQARETPRRRNATARYEPGPTTRTGEDVATVASSLQQPPDPPEYCSPWAA
jgi:hypothetical protein